MNTKAETLTQIEARGRLFATTLLDAGFSASEVRDASFGPSVRLADTEGRFLSSNPHTFSGTAANFRRKALQVSYWAFVAGVLAVIEERA